MDHSEDLPSVSADTLRWISAEYYGTWAFKCMWLWNTFLDLGLNGDHYDILESPPSAVEFSRLCHISRPVLIKGAYCYPLLHET